MLVVPKKYSPTSRHKHATARNMTLYILSIHVFYNTENLFHSP